MSVLKLEPKYLSTIAIDLVLLPNDDPMETFTFVYSCEVIHHVKVTIYIYLMDVNCFM